MSTEASRRIGASQIDAPRIEVSQVDQTLIDAPEVDTRPIGAPHNTDRNDLQALADQYRRVRAFTEQLKAPLTTEDCVVQTMEDVSPTKWHLAHTTWFFETFVLREYLPDYQLYHPEFPYLFNSYYVQAGARHCRDQRGYISRPGVEEVLAYRGHVDEQMDRLLARDDLAVRASATIQIGINHEQQHQELLLTDIKHVLSVNPLRPAYVDQPSSAEGFTPGLSWTHLEEGVYDIGHEGSGFAYDNEGPRHRTYIKEFLIANRPVTNGEFLRFIEDGGYRRPELWLSLGYQTVEERDWTAPFYWEHRDGEWWVFTLGGMKPLDPHQPASHITYFEADAYARWAGARLPAEQEWEVAAEPVPMDGNFVESGALHPKACTEEPSNAPVKLYGDVWEWTRSQYSPYPGYYPPEGAIGEYNGKFMCNQFVLRGGSCATSQSHIRATYRNFFPPEAAWQFTGFRLARDV